MVSRTGLFVAPVPGATPAGTSPTDGRLVLGSLFGTGAGCLSDVAFTASSTAMTLSIPQAVWRIPDPTNGAGVYLSPADPATVTISAGPASGTRIDVVWVRQNNYEAGDADSRVTYGVAAGIAASSPAAPSVPAGAMKIATITVPTGVSNMAACTVAQAYPQSVAPPSILAVTKNALPATGQFLGQRAAAAGIDYRWNGSSWRAWDSDWINYTPNVSGPNGAFGANPGFVSSGRYRWRAGRVLCEGTFFMNGGSSAITSGGHIEIFTPVAPDTANSHQNAAIMGGHMQAVDSSTSQTYSLAFQIWGNGNLVPLVRGTNGVESVCTGSNPFVWGQSDEVDWSVEYDPA